MKNYLIAVNLFRNILAISVLILTPSKDHIINLSKLLIFSTGALLLFLFAAGYIFPGGSIHYTDWAFAIVNDTKLPLGHAQREVGLPLLYLITGLTFFKSFIGVTLAYGVFGVLVVCANYISVSNISTSIAYYSSVFLIATVAPFSYIKFFYPDQLYIFLIQIFLMYLILYIWKGGVVYLYLFAGFAICASLTRTSGNLLFILLTLTLFLINRQNLKHYVACLILASAVYGVNQVHRYDIFDLASQTETKPVGKGYQILYSTYMYMGEFGYKITPELGPNSKLLLDRMREELSPSPRQSKLVSNQYGQTPAEFMEENVYKYNTEELIEKVLTEPGEEYFFNVIYPIKRIGLAEVNTDDEFQLNVVKEIWMGYPLYIIKYGFRNLALMLFDPGWSNPRYVKAQFIRQGVEFVGGTYGWGVYSADSVAGISERALREHEFYQLKLLPSRIQSAFAEIKDFHLRQFRPYVYATSLIMIIGWILTFIYLIERVTGRTLIRYSLSKDDLSKLCMIIGLTSFVLVYENAMTAWFSQPHFRYFHMTESCRFMLVSFAAVLILKIKPLRTVSLPNTVKSSLLSKKVIYFNEYLSSKRKMIILSIFIMQVLALSYWVREIVDNTWGSQQISVLNAYYQSEDGKKIQLEQAQRNKLDECIYFKCDNELQAFDELDGRSNIRDLNLTIEYQCRSLNENRVSKSRLVDGITRIELNCYN